MALSALGVTLIVGMMRVVNFAHGELYILGGYLSYHLNLSLGISPLAAMALSVVSLFAIGVALEAALIRRTYDQDMRSLIVTFILSIILQNVLLLAFGPYPNQPPSLVSGSMEFFGIMRYGKQRLLSAAIAAAILGVVFYLINRTWFGRSIRAVAQDRQMAGLCGVDVERTNAIGFGLGAAMAGAAGALFSPIFAVTPSAGSAVSLNAFVVIVLGGMGSLKGSLIGGLILGVVENLGAGFLSTGYRSVFGFLILILVLALRPQGLYGKLQR